MVYQNPTAISGNDQNFGVDSKFMVPQFAKPFNYEQQKSENEALVSGYAGAIGAQEKLPAMRERYEGMYNIPGLRESFTQSRNMLTDVGNQIQALPQQIKQTTGQSMVTEGQRAGMVQSKQAPLMKTQQALGQQTGNLAQMLSESEQNLNTAMQYDIAQQKKELEPWMWKYDMNNIMQAREFTGWSTANDMELRRLQTNQSTGVTMTENEKNRQQQLEMQKREFQQATDMLQKGYELQDKYSQSGNDWNNWN